MRASSWHVCYTIIASASGKMRSSEDALNNEVSRLQVVRSFLKINQKWVFNLIIICVCCRAGKQWTDRCPTSLRILHRSYWPRTWTITKSLRSCWTEGLHCPCHMTSGTTSQFTSYRYTVDCPCISVIKLRHLHDKVLYIICPVLNTICTQNTKIVHTIAK